ncbi:CDP-alcohol phosphatidyltransferase family protein [Phycicoccus sp. CSK15P-2]|uniref:CDP-alcohol phosphatidyltransferase family protein n=1 Tax=Phycicoccus sp. CSK15P-2 TaxID=2807627 RepID=UPI00194FF25D|nr:CDP-alcohol phosphatidyltransferase family protein [Phycicoccus sp. CSK15P-2]MBM6404286.1 CDP-alcohol phosphatidyltransferase family protein [Phycicoccus sp. CSK15P-2]
MTTALRDAAPSIAPPTPIGPVRTVPNAITLVRTVAAVLIGVIAVAEDDLVLLVTAYAVYWVGDVLDGWSARRLGQQTRLGAVFDIVGDRACTAVLCVGLVAHVGLLPGHVAVGVVFLLSFMVLDGMLSLAFLCWPLMSPNDFHLVDRQVWRMNWSTPAKAVNTAGPICALELGHPWLAVGVASGVVAVKAWSSARVLRRLGAL